MDDLTQTFEERLQEIEVYLDLLDALERQVQAGPPKIGGAAITAQQQKILYSCVYLQLYNLVEATVTWCVDAVCAAAAEKGRWRPADLITNLRREWVRSTARTHLELNEANRLEGAVQLCDHLVQSLPLLKWSIEGGRRGNWDDEEIKAITARLGCDLRISNEVYKGIKRPVREDRGSLVLIRYLRNKLAHGALSFTECGDGVTVFDLRDLKERTALYLREVVAAIRTYIDSYEFLIPASRP
jgi:MAE_28990/MAE_18760-like HEPN